MKVIKIINLSSRKLMVANQMINPRSTVTVPDNISMKERERISALSSVGVIKAFELDTDSLDTTKQVETQSTKRTRKTKNN